MYKIPRILQPYSPCSLGVIFTPVPCLHIHGLSHLCLLLTQHLPDLDFSVLNFCKISAFCLTICSFPLITFLILAPCLREGDASIDAYTHTHAHRLSLHCPHPPLLEVSPWQHASAGAIGPTPQGCFSYL